MSGVGREVTARSHSASLLLGGFLEGPFTRGKVLDRTHARFADYVVVLTEEGAPRVPNGVECAVELKTGQRIAIGGGRIFAGHTAITPGPAWDPRPAVSPAHAWPPGPAPLAVERGVGAVWQPEILAGYIAGLVLLHAQVVRARRLADAAQAGSDVEVTTMLRHAALGEVPEPVHRLFATGDVGALTVFDHGAGASWLRGLVSAGYALDVRVLRPAAGARR